MNSEMWKISILLFFVSSSYAFFYGKQCGLHEAGVAIQKLNDFPLDSSAGLFYDEEENLLYFVNKKRPALCVVCGKTAETYCVPIPGLKSLSAVIPFKTKNKKNKNDHCKMIALTDKDMYEFILKKDGKGKITKITTKFLSTIVKDDQSCITGSKVDQKGRLLIDVGDKKSKINGKVLHQGQTVISGLKYPLGIALSPNGKDIYQVDAAENVILKYCYKENTGQVDGKPQVVFNLTQETHLDGCLCSVAVTKDNSLWIGLCESGIVLNYNPNRKKFNQVVQIPASNPTSLEMGGPSKNVLFVGTTPDCKGDSIAAGSVFALSGTGTKGTCSYETSEM